MSFLKVDGLNSMDIDALRYVRNTNLGATKERFEEDHEPIGKRLWEKLYGLKLIEAAPNGRILLSPSGNYNLDEAK